MAPGHIYHNVRTEGNARAHFGDNYYFGEDSEDARIVLWLSHNVDPWARHRATYHKYHSGTLRWFLDDAKVTTWVAADAVCEDSARVLWCFGDMGTGKTTTTSRLAEQLRDSRSQHCQIAVVYCSHADSSYLTVQHILGLILAQLYSTTGDGAMRIPDNVKHAYRQRGHLGPALKELEGWLREAHVGTRAPLTLFLDGLDELRSSIRSGVLHALRPSSLPGIKLFMTSRFLPDEFESGEEGFAHTSIEFSSAEADIRHLILSSLESPAAYRLISLSKRVQAKKAHRVDVVREITTRIMAKADTFLLASCHMARILECETTPELYHCLDTLPETLNDHYDQAWKRVINQTNQYQRDQARIALTWVLLAKQPLSALALREVVALCMNDPSDNRVGGADFLPDIDRLCTGLVKLEKHMCPRWIGDGSCTQMEAHTRVVVSHTSFSEYSADKIHLYSPSGEQLIAKACIKIMRQSATMALRFEPMTSTQGREFFEHLWTPDYRNEVPTAETAFQYAMAWTRAHMSGLSAMEQSGAYLILTALMIVRASLMSLLAILFTLGVVFLNDFSDFSDGSFLALVQLHYLVGLGIVIQALQMWEHWATSNGSWKALVRELPCHPSIGHKALGIMTCVYVVPIYLAGQTAHFGLGEWGPLVDIFFCTFVARDYSPDADSVRTILSLAYIMGSKKLVYLDRQANWSENIDVMIENWWDPIELPIVLIATNVAEMC